MVTFNLLGGGFEIRPEIFQLLNVEHKIKKLKIHTIIKYTLQNIAPTLSPDRRTESTYLKETNSRSQKRKFTYITHYSSRVADSSANNSRRSLVSIHHFENAARLFETVASVENNTLPFKKRRDRERERDSESKNHLHCVSFYVAHRAHVFLQYWTFLQRMRTIDLSVCGITHEMYRYIVNTND